MVPCIPTGFHVSGGTLIQMAVQAFSCTGLHLLRLDFPFHSTKPFTMPYSVRTPKVLLLGLAFRVRSLLTESQLISLALLRCFSSGRFPIYLCIQYMMTRLSSCRLLHSKSADQSSLTAPRSLSQLVTSFFGSVPRHSLVLFVA